MPVTLLNNYPESRLPDSITKKDGTPLYGEIWVYNQFLQFNKNGLVKGENWYLKHDFNLSKHVASKEKVEGQVDFLLLSKYGLLVLEVKGGGLRVDGNDNYFSVRGKEEYQTQNPFNQAKEYTHTLKDQLNENVFVYRAVILPHEAGFVLHGPQLEGYKHLFFSKSDINHLDTNSDGRAINRMFYDFLVELAKSSRKKIIKELNPSWDAQKINSKCFEKYPELSSKRIKSLKSELFPEQNSFGFNPDKINSEIILNENYETLKGLRRNRKVIVQGAPGTGKTVLAKKFLAEQIIKQQKGIFYCANKLVKSKIEHSILRDYNVSAELISFKLFHESSIKEAISSDNDFLIFDEAQEYFNEGLYEFIEKCEALMELPRVLVLYDPKQTIIYDFNDISFYTDFYIESGFTHYYFDENYRCNQNRSISVLANKVLGNHRINNALIAVEETEKMRAIKLILDEKTFTKPERIFLVHSSILDSFKRIIQSYFKSDFEELTEKNINLPSSKLRYTTPIKYRGLENKSVVLITPFFREKTRIQNYVAITRAMDEVKLIEWRG